MREDYDCPECPNCSGECTYVAGTSLLECDDCHLRFSEYQIEENENKKSEKYLKWAMENTPELFK